jgi:hypothetical protein
VKTHKSSDPLVAFLYLLMRDHLPCGRVEDILEDIGPAPFGHEFTNGFLAQHAEDIAKRLRKVR